MPSSAATLRASSTADREQQPPCREASSELSRGHCCSVTPTTSWPCACSSAAATDESTPPDIATAILNSGCPRCDVRPLLRPLLHRRAPLTEPCAGSGRP